MVLEIRDGDEQHFLVKGILKAVVNINDILAHKVLSMDVWEQAEIDKLTVETLDGAKNEWCWSIAKLYANATLAMSMTRAGVAASEVSL